MKKLYIAIAFLIIALGLCVFEQYTVQSAYHQTTEYIYLNDFIKNRCYVLL